MPHELPARPNATARLHDDLGGQSCRAPVVGGTWGGRESGLGRGGLGAAACGGSAVGRGDGGTVGAGPDRVTLRIVSRRVWLSARLGGGRQGMDYAGDESRGERYGRLYTWESARRGCESLGGDGGCRRMRSGGS